MDYHKIIGVLQTVAAGWDYSLYGVAKDAIEELLRANETLRNEVAALRESLTAASEYRHQLEVQLQEARENQPRF